MKRETLNSHAFRVERGFLNLRLEIDLTSEEVIFRMSDHVRDHSRLGQMIRVFLYYVQRAYRSTSSTRELERTIELLGPYR